MPSIYMSNNVITIDETTNSVIKSSTEIKTEPIYNFIKMVDLNPGKSPRFIKPDFLEADLVKKVFLKQYLQDSIIRVDKYSFFSACT